MIKLQEGQCGLCAHFGEHHSDNAALVQMRVNGEAPPNFTDECGLDKMQSMNLTVTATSGCDGFTPAEAA